jgi:hypothetical protein
MKLQTALREPTTNSVQHSPSLSLTSAMDDGVIRIALELDARKRSLHPEIKRVVQKEVGQQRTDHSPYAKGNLQFDRVIQGWRSQTVLDLRRKR